MLSVHKLRNKSGVLDPGLVLSAFHPLESHECEEQVPIPEEVCCVKLHKTYEILQFYVPSSV